VLWDVDDTLVDADDIGRDLYQTAFREMFGGALPEAGPMGGRTDRAIVREVLVMLGVTNPGQEVDAFTALLRARAPGMAELARARISEKPGAARAIAALAALRDPKSPDSAVPGELPKVGSVVQSLLTGNVRELAEVKLGPFGFTKHLDLDAGAYGSEHASRARLVTIARRNAALVYQHYFAGKDTVLVGDTPMDVAAALATGARAVAVATGRFTVSELAAAGAHAVLPDLVETGSVVEAIVGRRPAYEAGLWRPACPGRLRHAPSVPVREGHARQGATVTNS